MTVAEPLLLILHVGYAWVVVGTALLGFRCSMPESRLSRRSMR